MIRKVFTISVFLCLFACTQSEQKPLSVTDSEKEQLDSIVQSELITKDTLIK